MQRLLSRETSRGKPSTSCLQSRKFYQNIFPNYTVCNVEIPNCYIKKFTSDGEYLLCFTKNLQGIQLYHFRGSNQNMWGNNSAQHEKKFETYFTNVYEKFLTSGNEVMCRDFCLTSACGNFLILASSGPPSGPPSTPATSSGSPLFTAEQSLFSSDAFSTPSFTFRPEYSSHQNYLGLSSLEDITFYLVGLKDGQVYDKRTFKKDFIHLANHAGVYLYNDLFAVLSLQTQTVHLFQIKGNSFIDVRTIGHQCYEDDDLEFGRQQELEKQYEANHKSPCQQAYEGCHPFQSAPQPQTAPPITCQQYLAQSQEFQTQGKPQNGLQVITANEEERQGEVLVGTAGPIVGIKHRLLAFLFRQAQESPNPAQSLRLFFQNFPQFSALVMWKMQLLDEFHLLLKFGSIDGLLTRSPADASNQTAFFVVYNLQSTEIVGIYENYSKEFAQTFEQFCEHFRACSCPNGLIKYRSTCSNNSFVREQLLKQKMAVMCAKNGGEAQATKRILSALPFSPQSWSESPYFDKSLFNYDEKVISSTERPKPCAEYAIKFYSREDGHVQFKINPGLPEKTDRVKRYASYVFHPFYPFIISIQHTLFQPSIVNFHFRHQDN
jgi:de-etiolated-1